MADTQYWTGRLSPPWTVARRHRVGTELRLTTVAGNNPPRDKCRDRYPQVRPGSNHIHHLLVLSTTRMVTSSHSYYRLCKYMALRTYCSNCSRVHSSESTVQYGAPITHTGQYFDNLHHWHSLKRIHNLHSWVVYLVLPREVQCTDIN